MPRLEDFCWFAEVGAGPHQGMPLPVVVNAERCDGPQVRFFTQDRLGHPVLHFDVGSAASFDLADVQVGVGVVVSGVGVLDAELCEVDEILFFDFT
jgi:hypothetical protein